MRLIYSNDLVPRVPFDDPLFQYKHLGPFHWSDAFYNVTVRKLEINCVGLCLTHTSVRKVLTGKT